MRRRVPEFRRPARRRFAVWIWCLLVIFLVVGLTLFVVHHQHKEPLGPPTPEVRTANREVHHEVFNLTKELLSATSFARQLVDQMTLAKAYLAKEHGSIKLAWELGSQIRSCQRLLSKAAVEGRPTSLEEAQPSVITLAQLIYKAQDAHYDIATTITTLRSHAQALEERLTAATVQSAEFGQLAAEAMPKYVHCLNIKLTVDWFSDPKLQKLEEEQRNSPQLVDNNLYHFCVFSDNVLATSVVVNSTVSSSTACVSCGH